MLFYKLSLFLKNETWNSNLIEFNDFLLLKHNYTINTQSLFSLY